MNGIIGQRNGPTRRWRATLAAFAAAVWLVPASAQNESRAGETGLRALEVWSVRGSEPGAGKGFQGIGTALEGAVAPKPENRLELTPAFRGDVGSYSVTIGYRERGVSVLAAALRSGARVEVAGTGPQRAALKVGIGMNNVDLRLPEGRRRFDVMRSFLDVPVGKSTILVSVAGADGGRPRVAELTVVRRDADLAEAEEQRLYFRAASLEGKADALSRAIGAGAEVDAAIAFGTQRASALVIGAGRGFADAVETLIRAGADVNALFQDPGGEADGAPALLIAVRGGHERIVGLLLAAGADPDLALPERGSAALAGGTPLIFAIDKNGDWIRIVRLLIEGGAGVNRALPDSRGGRRAGLSGASPLMLASYLGKADLVDVLIEAGADVNYRIVGERRAGGLNPQTAGLTALKLAKGRGHSRIADRLRAAGATR